MRFCSNCGAEDLVLGTDMHRCRSCGREFYFNPPSVGVAIVPVRSSDGSKIGVLLVQRTDGGFAFPGGYQGREELLHAAVRELAEETGVELPRDSRSWQLQRVQTTPNLAQNLCFYRYLGEVDEGDVPTIIATAETVATTVVWRSIPLKFSIHQEVLEEFFQEHA